MHTGKLARRPGSLDTNKNDNVEFDIARQLGNVDHDNHGAEARVVTDKNNTFTLEVPKMTTSVNRGKKEDVTISISRGSEFKESVKLQFHAPKGVTVTPAEPVIQAGQNKVTITIQAAGDAPAGKANIDVTAVPQTGKSVSLQMPSGSETG